jgi:hypothetical protein
VVHLQDTVEQKERKSALPHPPFPMLSDANLISTNENQKRKRKKERKKEEKTRQEKMVSIRNKRFLYFLPFLFSFN